MKKLLIALIALAATPAFALEAKTPLVCRTDDSRLEVNLYKATNNSEIEMRIFENGSDRPSAVLVAQELVARCMPAPGTDGCPNFYRASKRNVGYYLSVNLRTIAKRGSAKGHLTITALKTGRETETEMTCELVRRAY